MRRSSSLMFAMAVVVGAPMAGAGSAGAASLKVPRPAGGTVTVDWPVKASGTATVAPGTRLRVVVSQPSRGRAVPVTLSLVRKTAGGSTVRSKTLHRGVFAARVPADASGAYALVASTKRGWKHATRLQVRPATPAPAPAPVPSAPVPPAPKPVFPDDPCPSLTGPPSSTLSGLTVGAVRAVEGLHASVPRAAPVRATVVNTGSVCTAIYPTTRIDRLVDGGWVEQPVVYTYPNPAIWAALLPGATYGVISDLAETAPAGSYRLRVVLTRATRQGPSPAEPQGEATLPFEWAGVPAAESPAPQSSGS